MDNAWLKNECWFSRLTGKFLLHLVTELVELGVLQRCLMLAMPLQGLTQVYSAHRAAIDHNSTQEFFAGFVEREIAHDLNAFFIKRFSIRPYKIYAKTA